MTWSEGRPSLATARQIPFLAMQLRLQQLCLRSRHLLFAHGVDRGIDAAAARAHGVELALGVAPREPRALRLAQLLRAILAHLAEQRAISLVEFLVGGFRLRPAHSSIASCVGELSQDNCCAQRTRSRRRAPKRRQQSYARRRTSQEFREIRLPLLEERLERLTRFRRQENPRKMRRFRLHARRHFRSLAAFHQRLGRLER